MGSSFRLVASLGFGSFFFFFFAPLLREDEPLSLSLSLLESEPLLDELPLLLDELPLLLDEELLLED